MALSRPHPSQATTTALSTDNSPLNSNVKMPAPKFLTLRLKNTEKTMKDISPFYVKQGLDLNRGKIKNASGLRNGTLFVETFTENQSNALLKASLLGSYPIQVERHVTLNSSWGDFSTNALDGLSDEVVQSFLPDQSVSRANRLTGKRDDKPFPLRTIFLTFEVPDLPSHVYLGYERVPVRAYIPNPIRCFSCQKFGQTQQLYTSDITYSNCGEAGYGDSPCTNPSKCVNCQGNHSSNSKKCMIFLKEKDI
jgi:hypothetical protein